MEDGEAALRAALRRWRRGTVVVESQEEGAWATDGRSQAEGARVAVRESEEEDARAAERLRWWPRLTRSQVQALLGAVITLALLLWEQIRERLPK